VGGAELEGAAVGVDVAAGVGMDDGAALGVADAPGVGGMDGDMDGDMDGASEGTTIGVTRSGLSVKSKSSITPPTEQMKRLGMWPPCGAGKPFEGTNNFTLGFPGRGRSGTLSMVTTSSFGL